MSVRDSAGIQIVENDHTQPLWGGAAAWRLAAPPLVQVGNVAGDPDQRLYRVAHSLRLQSGAIAVANTGIGDVRVYDEQGYLLRTLEMPVEVSGLLRPLRLHELPGDSLLVVLSDRSVAVFDADGTMARRSGPLGAGVQSEPAPDVAGILGDGTVVLRAYPPEDTAGHGMQRTHVELLAFRPDGSPLPSLGRFESLTVLRGEEVLAFAPVGRQAVGAATIWYGAGGPFEVREVDLTGTTRRIVRLDRLPGAVTGADRYAYAKAAERVLQDTMEEEAAERAVGAYRFPDVFPSHSEIVVDRSGNVWVRAYQWFDLGAPSRWSVFDEAGRFLGDVEVPSLLEIHDIGEDYVLGRMSNGRGAEAVYLYTLVKPQRDD